MRGLTTLLFAIVALLAPAAGAQAEKRIALVIGNSAYQHTGELKNPRNDAADIAAALKRLKFEVFEGLDLDKRAMEVTIRKFALGLKDADVALFFYAGHGLQVNGQNYLVPIDARLEDASALDFEMIRLDLVHRNMERETKANLIFLDACRDNPLARNLARAMGTRSGDIGRGLAAVESGVGTLISFSTQPGNVALDGEGRNSPFASALARRILAEGEDLSSILINVRNDVMEATRNRQIPWEHSALRAKFFFTPPTKTNTQAAIELAYWDAAQAGGSIGAFKSYLERYPQGAYAVSAKLMIDKLRREEGLRAALAAREAELQRAEAKQRDERKKAEDAKRSEELIKAREEARKAQEAVRAAEAERLAALEELKRQKLAAAQPPKAGKDLQSTSAAPAPVQDPKKVASVPTPEAVKPTEPDPAAPDPTKLARDLQGELKRVGCDPGALDGKWGKKAQSALQNFTKHAKVKFALSNGEPTTAALEALAAQKGRVCPLACDEGEIAVKGKCVAKPQKAKKSPAPREEQASRRARPREDSPPQRSPERPQTPAVSIGGGISIGGGTR